MAPAHDLADLVHAGLNLGCRTGPRGAAQRTLLVAELLEVGAQRQDGPIVQGVSERGAFLFSNANHLARDIVPPDLLSERVDGGEKVFDKIHSDHADRSGAAEVRFRAVPAGT